jgi:hypothetical protein
MNSRASTKIADFSSNFCLAVAMSIKVAAAFGASGA